MKKNIIIGIIMLAIGILLTIIFINDFLLMVLGTSIYYLTIVMGSYMFLTGILLILISIKPLLKEIKNAKLISGLIYISLSAILITFGFIAGKDLFLEIILWEASTYFANIMGEILLLFGAIFLIYSLLIMFKGAKVANLILGILVLILGVVLFTFGFSAIFPYTYLIFNIAGAIVFGFLQAYFLFGFVFIIFGVIIIIKRKKG